MSHFVFPSLTLVLSWMGVVVAGWLGFFLGSMVGVGAALGIPKAAGTFRDTGGP